LKWRIWGEFRLARDWKGIRLGALLLLILNFIFIICAEYQDTLEEKERELVELKEGSDSIRFVSFAGYSGIIW
jgi:hypothetical protein